MLFSFQKVPACQSADHVIREPWIASRRGCVAVPAIGIVAIVDKDCRYLEMEEVRSKKQIVWSCSKTAANTLWHEHPKQTRSRSGLRAFARWGQYRGCAVPRLWRGGWVHAAGAKAGQAETAAAARRRRRFGSKARERFVRPAQTGPACMGAAGEWPPRVGSMKDTARRPPQDVQENSHRAGHDGLPR